MQCFFVWLRNISSKDYQQQNLFSFVNCKWEQFHRKFNSFFCPPLLSLEKAKGQQRLPDVQL